MQKIFAALVLFFAALQIQAQPNDQAERIAGFTRMYGIVRYFHPSDAAQEIDWNRFVLYSIQELQNVKTDAEYQQTLLKLFEPITTGLSIHKDTPTEAPEKETDKGLLVAWQHSGPGVHNFAGSDTYASQRTNRPLKKTVISGPAAIVQSIDATPYRGKTVRLAALARAEVSSDQAGAALVLRIDLPKGYGFFDNMEGRLIRNAQWQEYSIEGPVAENAVSIFIGVKAQNGGVNAGFDDVRLSVQNGDGKWEAIPVKNPGFETDEGWMPTGPAVQFAKMDQADTKPPQGKQWMKINVPAEFSPEPIKLGPPKWMPPYNVPLSAGFSSSVPIVLNDEAAKITTEQSTALASLKQEMNSMRVSQDTILADVVVAWAVLRHFYPYWDVVNVNWDERLIPLLELALNGNGTCETHSTVLRKLFSEIRDGHAQFYKPNNTLALIPIAARFIEGKIVVVASSTNDMSVGDVIQTIDGQSAQEWFSQERELVSGSEARRDSWTIPSFLLTRPQGTTVRLTVESKDGTQKNVALSYTKRTVVNESRPDEITELHPGIWYVDLTRASGESIQTKLTNLARAKGVIFDLRGYPTDAAVSLLTHLIDAPENDRWMHIPHYLAPAAPPAGWDDVGWDLKPEKPAIAKNRVFLTDGRAISYAESIMGYVKDKKLATIIGSTTAGTNGDVVMVELPSGTRFWFTGLKVTHHDGTSRFHLLGIEPDKVVKQTLAGIRAGRDEVLESAVDHLQNR
jgi:C-terminal processing protease CtpA/Prc